MKAEESFGFEGEN